MILPEELQCLKAIALLGGCRGPVRVSSQSLGATLGTSPQTASRRLQSLERQRLVSRTIAADGQDIMVTPLGEGELRKEYQEYSRIFSDHNLGYVLTGTVISGIGEGKYYMSLEPYKEQFNRVLGFEPYPGTLNIRLFPSSIPLRKKIEALDWIRIKGFSSDGRTFGDARCLPCRIGDVSCGIVVPGRTHYPDDVIEVIAPVALRRKLGVEDSDTVTVEVGE
ncbi:MAG: Riboflavin kinase [Methanoregulaceae archaeon PtaB.Bin009]|nr:MAG: Riboflavin kinase [Methanoregulaceae archaeon PtaB.Bin009]